MLLVKFVYCKIIICYTFNYVCNVVNCRMCFIVGNFFLITNLYYQTFRNDAVASNKTLGSPPGYRRRSPFVPFALKNDTGSRLWFTTITTANDW